MIHPIFMTVLRHPDLLISHLSNYVELVKGECSSIGVVLAIRAAGVMVALAALLLALLFSGIALMLGFMHHSFHPVLVVVPGMAWAFVLIGAALALKSGVREQVADVKAEVDADLDLLRLVKAARHD